MGPGTPTKQVSELPAAVREELANSIQLSFAGVYLAFTPSLSHWRDVSNSQLRRWKNAVWIARNLPGEFRKRVADTSTHDHVGALANRAGDAVQLPAALALLSRLPPALAMQAVMAHRDAGDLWRYVNGPLRPPEWWRRPCVAYRAWTWERLCLELAEAEYGPVLAGLRGETLCAHGLIPDIIVGEVVRDADGVVVRAEHIIDAKSGRAPPHEHAYADRCDVLEYWHAGHHGQWVERPCGHCTIIYQSAEDLQQLARPHGLGERVADFAEGEDYFGLYLQFVLEHGTRDLELADLHLAGTLHAEEGEV
ncbi:MAG: hypothetical protein U9R79_10350 [Armatimonadota bacterium]|nr:hypothetical protein [Armatimonadota bacterium]